MKHILTTLIFSFSLFTSLAQAPQMMTYQAVIRDAGGSLISNSTIGFEFNILQGSPGGSQVFTETNTATTNDNGLLTYEIGSSLTMNVNWGNGPHFLEANIDPTGGSNYTITSTTQLLSVPYSLYAEEAALATNVVNDNVDDADSDPANELQTLSVSGVDLTLSNGNTVALPSTGNTLDQAYDQGGAGTGRFITVDAGEVELTTATTSGIALRVENTNTGTAMLADATNTANTFSTIQSSTNSNSSAASAIIGNSNGAAWGVSGQVQATASAESAVYGSNLRTTGGYGVYGIGVNGVVGETNYSQGNAIWGENYDAVAPLGNGIGVAGKGYYGVIGEDRYLGSVTGAYGVFSNGNFAATGTKSFIIDHPSNPENKFLRHFSTESNEVLNIYRGNAVFNENGEAIITLPEYYDDINKNPSYNLTPVGGFAQLYVKEEISGGTFIIGGGTVGQKVSWTIYAERNDRYLQEYPAQRDVELEKREGQKGTYLMPQLYGQPTEKAMIQSKGKTEVEQPVIKLKKR